MNSPLRGIKIIDFTHLLPGQICSGLLADLGANLLHIQAPKKQGLAHQLPPVIEGESLYFWVLHKRKSSLTVDLKSKDGLEVVKRLIKDADIVVENFRPGVMKRLGLDWRSLKSVNEKLIYCSISGYGQESKERRKAAHDLNLIAESGILGLNRRPGERPVLPAIPISDYMSGLLAVVSVLSALFQRQTSGKGQYLDISMLDSALSSLNILTAMSMYTEKEPEEGGFAYPLELPNYKVYKCKDERYLAVASLEPQFWKEFLDIIGRSDLLDVDLVGDQERVTEELEIEIQKKSLKEWRHLFEESNCCVSPVNTISEALALYPLEQREMLHTLNHPVLGNVPQVTFPVSANLRDKEQQTFCVEGSDQAHNMLLESGFSQGDIENLQHQGIISLYIEK